MSMLMNRNLLTTLSLIAVVCVMASCSKEPETESRPGKPRVALIMKSLANEFFKTMEDGARADAAKNPELYELRASGIQTEQDVSAQIKLVNDMIGQKVDAIVIAPADSKSLVPVCKKAVDAGIVVINIDNKLDADALSQNGVSIPFVGPDNRKAAKLAGDHLAAKLKAGDEVVILEGLPTAFNAQQRKAGFEDAIAGAKLQLVASQTGKWEADEARKVLGSLLPGRPNLKGVLCANDSMAVGAVAALRTAGRDGVLVAGIDNIKAVQDLIRQGRVLCTVDQHADQIAVFGIHHAIDLLAKKGAVADRDTPVDLVTADQLK